VAAKSTLSTSFVASDKVMRLTAQAAHFPAGVVHFPEDAPWLDELMAELLGFPGVRHDDQVESISQALAFITWRQSQHISSQELRFYRLPARLEPYAREIRLARVSEHSGHDCVKDGRAAQRVSHIIALARTVGHRPPRRRRGGENGPRKRHTIAAT
jgi:hypothetical protein